MRGVQKRNFRRLDGTAIGRGIWEVGGGDVRRPQRTSAGSRLRRALGVTRAGHLGDEVSL